MLATEVANRAAVMNMTWSRWVFGAWAVVAAVWLVVATLLLVQTWPQPSVTSGQGGLLGYTEDESMAGRPIKGQAGVRASPGVRERIRYFLLFAVVPPGFLLALVCAGLWIARLPFPSWRRGGRDKLPSSR